MRWCRLTVMIVLGAGLRATAFHQAATLPMLRPLLPPRHQGAVPVLHAPSASSGRSKMPAVDPESQVPVSPASAVVRYIRTQVVRPFLFQFIIGWSMLRRHTLRRNELKKAEFEEQASRITWVGAAVNFALAFFKLFAGVVGNSAAMIADAGHSFSDLISDGLTLVALRMSSLPADVDHPYGHGTSPERSGGAPRPAPRSAPSTPSPRDRLPAPPCPPLQPRHSARAPRLFFSPPPQVDSSRSDRSRLAGCSSVPACRLARRL